MHRILQLVQFTTFIGFGVGLASVGLMTVCCGSISEESDTNAEWHIEGRRLVPTIHRHISHGGHSSTRNLPRSERPVNLRSAAAASAAAPAKQGLNSHLICS